MRDKMVRGSKRPEKPEMEKSGMLSGSKKPVMPPKPNVTLPYMPQKPVVKPAMPMRRAKGGMAKGKKK